MNIIERGNIGNIRYEIRYIDKSENVYEVVIFQKGMGLCVVRNTGKVACDAFIAGMKVGKCRNIYSVASKNMEFTEYGYAESEK